MVAETELPRTELLLLGLRVDADTQRLPRHLARRPEALLLRHLRILCTQPTHADDGHTIRLDTHDHLSCGYWTLARLHVPVRADAAVEMGAAWRKGKIRYVLFSG